MASSLRSIPGNMGRLLITGPVTINGNGWAAITAPAGGQGNGIVINAGSTDKIALIGLEIDGANAANSGVQFNTGMSLTIVNCVVRNMNGDGVDMQSSDSATFAVSNSYFNDNTGAGFAVTVGTSPGVTGSFDQTGFYGNGTGLVVFGGTGPADVAVKDSIAANNATGFSAGFSGGTAVANVSLMHVQASGNTANGIEAGGSGTTVWLAQSTVAGNGAGWNIAGATIDSYGDNYFSANGTSTGVLSVATKQ